MKLPLDHRTALFVLLLFHVSGAIGLQTQYADFFIEKTPLNLLLCLGLVILSDPNQRSIRFWILLLAISLFGFFLEVVGVNTGFPFGEYSYGAPFGWRWEGTPFLIGINWFLMVYGGALIAKNLSSNPVVSALLAGTLIVLIDLVLEPVAIHLDFWTWSTSDVPIQNYLTWWVVVAALSFWLYRFLPNAQNKVANYVIVVQFLFFLSVLLSIS